MTNNNTTERKAMFSVFQIEVSRDYPATIGLSYEEALDALRELQCYNPETVFVIRQVS